MNTTSLQRPASLTTEIKSRRVGELSVDAAISSQVQYSKQGTVFTPALFTMPWRPRRNRQGPAAACSPRRPPSPVTRPIRQTALRSAPRRTVAFGGCCCRRTIRQGSVASIAQRGLRRKPPRAFRSSARTSGIPDGRDEPHGQSRPDADRAKADNTTADGYCRANQRTRHPSSAQLGARTRDATAHRSLAHQAPSGRASLAFGRSRARPRLDATRTPSYCCRLMP